MPSFIALGYLENVEKFTVGWGGQVGGLISIPTTKLHQPEVGLGWAVTTWVTVPICLFLLSCTKSKKSVNQ